MSWLNYSGHTAADFPMDIRGGGSIPAYLLHPHNAIADAFSTLAPALKDYLEKKKNDEIANQLMNMENPPRAQAVDPSIQGAPATVPARGGQQAYKAQKLYQDYISKQQADQSQSMNDYWTNKLKEVNANKIQADANAPDDRVEITLADGRKVLVTPNEAAQHDRATTHQPVDPTVDSETGAYWNGARWVNPSKTMVEDSVARREKLIQIEKDIAAQQSEIASGDVRPGPDWLPLTETRQSKLQQLQKERELLTPKQKTTGAQTYQQRLTEPAPPGKQLDPATAKSILAETGGDKQKARQLARQRGYIFQ